MLIVAFCALLVATAANVLLSAVRPADREARMDQGQPAPQPSDRVSPAPVELEPESGEPFVLSADREGQEITLAPGRARRIQVRAGEGVAVQLGENGPIELADRNSPAEFTVFGKAGLDEPIRRLDPVREIGRVTTREPGREEANRAPAEAGG